MKTTGFIIVIIGLLLLVSPAFTTFITDKIEDVEEFATDVKSDRTVDWKQYLGLGVLVLGVTVFVLSTRRRRTM